MAAAKPKDQPALNGTQKVMEEGDAVARFILDTIDQAVYGKLDSAHPSVSRLMDLLVDEDQDLYIRGLASRGLGAVCLKVRGAKAKMLRSERWGGLVDALLDVIGLCNGQRARRTLVETDRDRLRRNACTLLSVLMDESVATMHPATHTPLSPSHVRRPPPPRQSLTLKPRGSVVSPAAGPGTQEPDVLLSQWNAIRMELRPARMLTADKARAATPSEKRPRGTSTSPQRPPKRASTTSQSQRPSDKDGSQARSLSPPRLGSPAASASKASGGSLQPPPSPVASVGGDLMRRVKQAIRITTPPTTAPTARKGRERGKEARPAGGKKDRTPARQAPANTTTEVAQPPVQASSVPAAPVTAATASTSRPRARDVAHPPPPPRPSVIFGEDLPHDHAWAPGTRANDYLEKDRKLGYQIPRLWFPQTLAGGIGRENGRGDPRRNGLCVPDPRPPPLKSVAHPPSVARLEAEHHQLLSYHNYCALHELVKKGKAGARRAAGVERRTWAELVASFKRNADLDSFKHEWTPRHGASRQGRRGSPSRHVSPPRGLSGSASVSPSARRRRGRPGTSDARPLSAQDGFSPIAGILRRPGTASPLASTLRVKRLAVTPKMDAAAAKWGGLARREAECAHEAKATLRKDRLQRLLTDHSLTQGLEAAAVGKEEQEALSRALGAELQAVRDHAHFLHANMLRTIEREKAAMPWTTLVLLEGGAQYVKQRLARALQLWAREFERSQVTMALALWKLKVAAHHFEEDSRRYRHIAGRDKFATVLRRLNRRRKAMALEKLIYKVAWCIWEERNHAAGKIQTQYRRWTAYVRFLAMHDERVIDGPLADIFLERPRPSVSFYIDPRVRHERRRLWLAVVTVQKEFRKMRHHKLYLLAQRSVLILQRNIRMWSDRRAYLYLRKVVIRLQSVGRMLVAKWWYRLIRLKALVIQKYIRAHLGRCHYYQRRYIERHRREEGLHVHALRIQRTYRGYRAREVVADMRELKQRQWYAALRMQGLWYKYKRQYPTFVLLASLREFDKAEAELAALVIRRNRYFNARKIQRLWRARWEHRRESAAVKLQCYLRGLQGYDLLSIMRKQRWASRKLRHWGIVVMRKRNRAASAIAFWWFHLRPGRLLRHLEDRAQRMEDEEAAKEREERYLAASRIQAAARGKLTRRLLREVHHIIAIQSIIRGFLGRCLAKRRRLEARHLSVIRYVRRLLRDGVYGRARLVYLQRVAAATQIQRCGRGYVTRRIIGEMRSWARKNVLMAVRIQRAYRAHVRVVAAFKAFTVRKREVRNAFKHMDKAAAVTRVAMRTGLKGYHPENEQLGMPLSSWLRRLGAPEVLPLFKAAKVERLEQVAKLTEVKLQTKCQVDEKVAKGTRTGVFEAALLRKRILTLAKMIHVPPRLRPPRVRELYRDFTLMENDVKRSALKQLFLTAYGARLLGRAETFATEVGACPILSTHLVRRFLRMHNSASLARDHQEDLVSLPDFKAEQTFELHRILNCAAILQDGVERLALVLPPAMTVTQRLREARDAYVLLLTFQKFQAPFVSDKRRAKVRPAAPTASPTKAAGGAKKGRDLRPTSPRSPKNQAAAPVAVKPAKPPKEAPGPPVSMPLYWKAVHHCRVCYALLDEVWEAHLATSLITRRYKAYARRKREALTRHDAAAQRIYSGYLEEVNTNYVRRHWEAERRREALEAIEAARQAQLATYKLQVEASLQHVMPFGWQREWVQGEQANQDDEGEYLYRRRDAKGKVKEEQPERPFYRYEEDRAARLIEEVMRAHVVRRVLRRRQRARRKAALEERQKKVWADKAVERNRAVTLRIEVGSTAGSCTLPSDLSLVVKAQEAQKEFESRVSKLMEMAPELRVGLPVHARFGGLDYYYPGSIYQVNPTPYVSREGMKMYPKGTWGVLYDDGDCEPAVSKPNLRVLKLKVGMRVEARFQGGAMLYPAKVMGFNERDGAILSYRLLYDDGEEEKAVRRHLIRVADQEAIRINRKLDALAASHEAYKTWLSERREEVRRLRGKWDGTEAKMVARFEDLLLQSSANAAYAASVKNPASARKIASDKNKSPRKGFDWKPLREVAEMASLSHALWERRRRRASVSIKIEYTRMALPYGWTRQVDPSTGVTYYVLTSTGQRRRGAPSYSHLDDLAARQLQAAWRGFLAKRDFGRMLNEESPVVLAQTAIQEGAKHAWVGMGEEGISLEMWLNRLGLGHVYRSLVWKGGGKLNPALTVDRLRRMSEEELRSLGISSSTDRKLMRAMAEGEANVASQFKLLNYYVGPGDPRALWQCVQDSRGVLYNLFIKAYPGNASRVERLVDIVSRSGFPLSHQQVSTFLKKYAGKAAAAQENANELVDVRTTSKAAEERKTYEVYVKSCQRLCVLLSTLKVQSLLSVVKSAIDEAAAAVAKYPVPGEDKDKEEEEEEEEEDEEGFEEDMEAGEQEQVPISVKPPEGNGNSPSPAKGDKNAAEGKAGEAAEGSKGKAGVVNNKVAKAEVRVNPKKAAAEREKAAERERVAEKEKAERTEAMLRRMRDGSGPEGKGAYVLRRRALERVFAFDHASRRVQTSFRGYRARKWRWRIMEDRMRCIVTTQSLWRRYRVRCLRLWMLSQQQSVWEQLWSNEHRAFYYYNKATGDALWEEPGGGTQPYRPMVRDRYSGKLIQAWPCLDAPPPLPKKAMRGMCMRCITREANRRCNTCFDAKSRHEWNKGYKYFCFACYAEVHRDDVALREHGFTVIKSVNPPQLRCSVCSTQAVRRCRGIMVEAHHRQRLAGVVAAARVGDSMVRQKLEDFVRVWRCSVGLEYSYKKLEFMYAECTAGGTKHLNPAALWTRVTEVVDDFQEPCGENYCAQCWEDSHRKGQRSLHTWTGFAAHWPACTACEKEPVTRQCEDCDDGLCDECFRTTHVRGRRRRHVWTPAKEPVDEEQGMVHCHDCERRVGKLECPQCREMLCDSCLAFGHPRVCAEGEFGGAPETADRVSHVDFAGHSTQADEEANHGMDCVVCGKPPDVRCVQCGDVYCSVRWMGNPGCFAKMHRKGKRRDHKKVPYMFAVEKEARDERKRVEEERKQAEVERQEAIRFKAKESVDKRVAGYLADKQRLRRQRLLDEAQAEFRQAWGEKHGGGRE